MSEVAMNLKSVMALLQPLIQASDNGLLLTQDDMSLLASLTRFRDPSQAPQEELMKLEDVYQRFVSGDYDHRAWLYGIPCLTRGYADEVYWRAKKVSTLFKPASQTDMLQDRLQAEELGEKCRRLEALGYQPSPIRVGRSWCLTTPDQDAPWHRLMTHMHMALTHRGKLAGVQLILPGEVFRIVWWHQTRGHLIYDGNGHWEVGQQIRGIVKALNLQEDRRDFQSYSALANALEAQGLWPIHFENHFGG